MNYLIVIILFVTTIFSPSVVANSVDSILESLESSLLSKPEQAIKLMRLLEDKTDEFNSEQQAKLKTLKSVKLIFDGDYSKALILLSEAEKLSPPENQLNSIYLYQATAYISLKDYKSGLSSMSKNLSRITLLDNSIILSSTYQRLANLYLQLEAYDETAFYAKKTLELSAKSDTKARCYSSLLISVTKLKLEQLTRAKSEFSNTLSFCEENNFPLITAMSKKGLGMVELKLGHFDNAKELLLNSLTDYNKFEYQLEINHVNSLLAEVSLGLKDIVAAEKYAFMVINLPSEISNLEFKKSASKVLSQLAYREGDLRRAYDYLALHQALSKTLLDDTKAKANAYQMAKFENDEKTREINLLNKDRELYTTKRALTDSQRNNELMLMTLIIGGSILLTIFASVMTLQKRKYKRLAQLDTLTGIFNRGTAQNIGEVSFIETTTTKGLFSVVMFDLDYFKKINDNYGHGTGDWVLKKVAEVIRKHTRGGDIFSRFGGEEFALFMPDTDSETARRIAEECCELIQLINTKYSGHTFKVTASFGVSSNTDNDLSLDPLLHRADIAMYCSKEQGRNRVSVYTLDMEQSRTGYQASKFALS